MDKQLQKELITICSSAEFDVNMGYFTTLNTGGRALARLEISSKRELEHLLVWLRRNNLSWRILGGGSNILVGPSGFHGLFIRLLGDFSRVEKYKSDKEVTLLSVGAGCSLAKLVSHSGESGLTGLEWATGIPGTIGGAVRMNAGAFGLAMADCLVSVRSVNEQGEYRELAAGDINFEYRRTLLQGETEQSRHIITGVIVQLNKGDKKAVLDKCKLYRQKRRIRQPQGVASAGSFFKNPDGDAAGRLIDAAGLKGFSCGGAKISQIHGNFIINTGGATPGDLIALMKLIQEKVHEDSGVWLEPEVHIIEE